MGSVRVSSFFRATALPPLSTISIFATMILYQYSIYVKRRAQKSGPAGAGPLLEPPGPPYRLSRAARMASMLSSRNRWASGV